MAYIKLYCKKNRLRPNGTAPIYLALRIASKEKLLSSGHYINPDLFDNKSEKVKHKKLQLTLNEMKAELEDVILDLEREKKPVTFDTVIARHKINAHGNFIKYAREKFQKAYDQEAIGYKTWEQHRDCLKVLEAYRPDVKLHEITVDWLQDYEYYLKNVKNRAKNTRFHDFKTIRRVMNLAREDGLIKEYPFRKFKFSQEETNPDFLLVHELNALVKLYYQEKLNGPVQRTLGNFLFSCMTGVSGREMRDKESIRFEGDQIIFTRKKTGAQVYIPLHRKAKDLWADVKDRNLKQKYVRVNKDIAEALQEAGINKKVTYHESRHTFGVIGLIKGMNLAVISKILGHKSIKTTEIYARIVDDLTRQEMMKWDD